MTLTHLPKRVPIARIVLAVGLVASPVTACDRAKPTVASSASVSAPTAPEVATPAPALTTTASAVPPQAGSSRPTAPAGSTTVTGRASTVTGTVDRATLTAYAQMADSAVAEVSERWKRTWPRRVVIIAPRDAAQFREQVGRADDLGQVAAITDGPIGPHGRATGDRIVLNPDAFARLTAEGRQFVLTHETTHVAVRSSLAGAAPLWLVEGYADHVGYSGSDRSRTDLAASLLERVRSGKGPTRLPTQGDFDPAQGEIAPTYLGAWLAVDLIASRYGEGTLRRFYEASTVTDSSAAADTATDRAFVDVLGTTRAAFTKSWLAELDRLAG
ncbi:hypothetical protein [Knoellia subterranea]|uniref:hypothetical protein n=1 Tax=Knoellia subterranea TaxID=184882 RepID=UPI0012EB62AF|nr:hypothetical protein [Knoellia subterranea]